jgi:2TM domain
METSQHELYEYARQRIKQKKKLYFHFVLFILASILFFVLNKCFGLGEPNNWFLWVSTFWLFLLVLNFIKVFITDRFMNKNWEREQIDKLVAKQELKISEIAKQVQEQK